MKVVATNKYEELNLKDITLGRIPIEGEEFETTEERFDLLGIAEHNPYNAIFVVKKEDKIAEVETAKKQTKTEKAVRKTTKKK